MDYLTGEIRQAAEAGLWHVALQASLAAVDICAALSAANGETTGPRFKEWSSRWLGETPIHPDDLWQLRCGMLHEGRMKYKNAPRIVFTIPTQSGWVVHGNSVDGVLQIDLAQYCEHICSRIDTWWHLRKDEEPVRSNATHLVRERPEGLPGYGDMVRIVA